ncbi:hypothetical protein AK830_g7876 [Neonectria ditissima]|uniref:Uncharacterized protein n=1 Tax=Neonectria ditissima TaxID=78410 RepID=A0A0P7ALM5_9HYPO|nr:hypothetical protein AK830_g7876 [Neonectria ditissima]
MFFQHRTVLSLAVAQALMAPSSFAQSLDATIVGCAEADCPTAGRSTSSECQLVDKNLSMIGLARVPVESDTLEGLSWVEGVAIADSNDGNRAFDKSFYLGTPPSLSLNDTGACALFFTHVSTRVKFEDDDTDVSVSQGTCEDAMSKECVSALTSRAEDLDVDGLSSKEACKKLQEEFEDNLDSECSSFADGSKWVGLETTALSGVEPISSKENSSSECWPITPKAYDLSFVRSFETEGDYLADTLANEFYGIVPILTFFFPRDSHKIVSKAEAQMTCMKTIDSSVASNSTKSSGSEDEDNAGETLIISGHVVVSFFVAASLFLLV